ncbi:MAG: response regulator transcription factor [Chloroflexota bacterium]|nr:response regulator transcription factor [Chloroflexota bacterium]
MGPGPDESTSGERRRLAAPLAGLADQERALVLVVEDDPTLLSTLAFNLSREGYQVLTACDGEQGLALAIREAEQLDLMLLDLMLPGMSGFDVLRRLRSTSDVPVLILSARGETDDKVDGFEFGADDYITKPFVLRELLARVRATVRRRALPAARPPSVLQRGPLRIELERRTVRIDNQEVRLRPKEYGLLTTLAMEPGKVFSRQDLLDLVWGEEVIVDERTVDVHISWLRGKLTEAGLASDAIRTVYGAGYRFLLHRADPLVEAEPIVAGGL